jgi:pimeloyl-ACP methyl ester carboxylesterase
MKLASASLEVVVWGFGPRVVFVHGAVFNGPLMWKEQRPLGERWRLEVLNRRGYGKSPPPEVRSDFEEDARDIAALLGDDAHLVGHSYGAIGALYAAALRPQAVRSLTINEPPAYRLMKGNAEADAIVARLQATRRDVHEPRAFLEAFRKIINGPGAPSPCRYPSRCRPTFSKAYSRRWRHAIRARRTFRWVRSGEPPSQNLSPPGATVPYPRRSAMSSSGNLTPNVQSSPELATRCRAPVLLSTSASKHF